ncbi:ABC transporter permease [Anoxynatronum buryatiense]|uniref:Nucleoside ABC transporter membrane protein n=1 Tax=Anoxynatronum buryatiense TaxID=489973 RepID=A0AA45WVK0_9CLOT|nr:ABC transporter permease [Anoxynatronum buryatiense]SMP52310.1 nucleoside ABC transporter membrane protein [Anoxynatronum buryatiense]
MHHKQPLGNESLRHWLRRFAGDLKQPALAIFAGLVVGGMVIALSGFHPLTAIGSMLKGGFGSAYYLTTTLTRATPIIFAGLAAALAWGSGYPSLGASGQMILGALVCSQAAVRFTGPPLWVITLSLLCGMLGGMLYSLLAAWISDRFKLYLLIVTLMLNYIADYIASYTTTYLVKDPFGADASAIQTQRIESGILPRIFTGYTVHWGFVIALITVIAILFIMKKTTFGYRARMGGLNPRFAEYGGINSRRMMYGVLLLSGALAGLGGACEVLGARFRYVDGMITSPGYAWSGIIASLMANNHPVGIFFSSIFLAGLTTGGGAIERSMGVPSEVTTIIQSVITLLITARFVVAVRKRHASPAPYTPPEGGDLHESQP